MILIQKDIHSSIRQYQFLINRYKLWREYQKTSDSNLSAKQLKLLKEQKELKDMLGCSVDLELFVRVEKNWRNHENKIKEFGLDELEQIDED